MLLFFTFATVCFEDFFLSENFWHLRIYVRGYPSRDSTVVVLRVNDAIATFKVSGTQSDSALINAWLLYLDKVDKLRRQHQYAAYALTISYVDHATLAFEGLET